VVNAGKMVNSAGTVMKALLGLGLVGLLFLIIYGNLSGNLGFVADSTGANNTNAVINNLTGGVLTFFGFSNTFFTLTAITLLIAIVLIVINLVGGKKSGGGFTD